MTGYQFSLCITDFLIDSSVMVFWLCHLNFAVCTYNISSNKLGSTLKSVNFRFMVLLVSLSWTHVLFYLYC